MNALALAGIFFITSFADPETTATVIGMAAMANGWQRRDDRFIKRWIAAYNSPNQRVLWLTDQLVKSNIAIVYDIPIDSELPNIWRNKFGLIVIDYEYPFGLIEIRMFDDVSWILKYCHEALADNGSLLILDGRKVVMRILKE